MSNDYRHATDRKELTAIAGCPNGHQTLELETEGKNEAVDDLVDLLRETYGECAVCGADFGLIQKGTPTEVLE